MDSAALRSPPAPLSAVEVAQNLKQAPVGQILGAPEHPSSYQGPYPDGFAGQQLKDPETNISPRSGSSVRPNEAGASGEMPLHLPTRLPCPSSRSHWRYSSAYSPFHFHPVPPFPS